MARRIGACRWSSKARWFGPRQHALRRHVIDENWSWPVHQLEVQNLTWLQPSIIRGLQRLIADYPDWSIILRIDVQSKRGVWPGMGIVIYPDEIVDELRRDVQPTEFRDVIF